MFVSILIWLLFVNVNNKLKQKWQHMVYYDGYIAHWYYDTVNVVGVMCAVCPANWTPQAPTIKPDPVGSKEYFSTVN